jgi:hypothetical protein
MARGTEKPKRSWTVYSDADKAKALIYLDLCDGDFDKASSELGIPDSSLRTWAEGKSQSADVPKLRANGRMQLAAILEDIAFKALHLVPGKLEKASAESLIRIADMATNKLLLLQGQPTQITEQRMPQEEALARVAALVEQARAALPREAEEPITTIEGEVR